MSSFDRVQSAGTVDVDRAGRQVVLEYAFVGVENSTYPTLVFLHEGLGSLRAWKDFPGRLCEAGGFRGLVYSRYGYGGSTPKPAAEKWSVDFMHVEARRMLPQLLAALHVERPWLFGHSDGASIALLYAAQYPDAVSGVVVVAPHVFVEDVALANIGRAREAYEQGDLRARLARYHADPDSAFRGWNDIWLDEAFVDWNIEAALQGIVCPLLALQGEDDEYGTLAQLDRIQRALPRTTLAIFPDCGHSPHRSQPQALIDNTVRFIHAHSQTPI
jgi:pimeloyl-ACP methyl ester carboxylesterase